MHTTMPETGTILRIGAHDAARALRALLKQTDRLHPAALLGLVLVLVGLAYAAAPAAVALLTAAVGIVKAGAFLAGAGVLARLAIRAAVTYTANRAGATTA